MSEKRPKVIFATHGDDEVIGCWTELNKKDNVQMVVYFALDSLGERAGTRLCSDKFNFTLVYCSLYPWRTEDLATLHKNIPEDAILFVPHPLDHHEEHQLVRAIGEQLIHGTERQIKYYSVDMNVPGVRALSQLEAESKLSDLETCYPSKRQFWMDNKEAYMFEGIFDHPSPPWIEVKVEHLGEHFWKNTSKHRKYLKEVHPHMFEVVLRLYPSGIDRAIEFHDAREHLWRFVQHNIFNQPRPYSCEEMAGRIYYWAKQQWGVSCRVTVAEEGGLKSGYGDV